jgi:ribonuclease HI
MYTMRFDGMFKAVPGQPGAEQNTGLLCYGWTIAHNGDIIGRGHGAFARSQDATSLVAEYLAMLEGLKALHDLGTGAEHVRVVGDARSVIQHMRGNSPVTAPAVVPLYRRARRLADRFCSLAWDWTPRKNNRHADRLSRRALDQLRRDPDHYHAALLALLTSRTAAGSPAYFRSLLSLSVFGPASQLSLGE